MSFESIITYLHPLFWISTRAANVQGTPGRIIFVVFILVFVLGVIARVMTTKQTDKYKKITFTQLANMLVTMGLLGALLFFFSSERIQFFGARFWYPVWIVTLLIWMGYIFHFAKKKSPLMRKQAQERKEKRKYIPKTKKKGNR